MRVLMSASDERGHSLVRVSENHTLPPLSDFYVKQRN